MKRIYYAICLPLLFGVIGCASSPYVDGYLYMPRPAVADIPASQPSQPPPVVAYASIEGVRYEDSKQNVPESVEVRLRLDNNGTEAASFDPRSLELNTGDLIRLGPPVVSSQQVNLNPGESALVTAYFPFPNGKYYDDFNLETLQLRWSLMIGPQRVEQIADFRQEYQQTYYYRDDPYWGPYYYGPRPFIGGVVVVRRR